MPKKTSPFTLLIIILIGGIAVASLYVGKKLAQLQEEPPASPSIEPEEVPPEIASTEPSGIDTSEWKTYRNQEYGFEVKYPKHWTVKDFSNFMFIGFTSPKSQSASPSGFGYTGEIKIRIRKNPRKLSIDDFYNGIEGPDLFSGTQKYSTLEIGGKLARRYTGVLGLINSTIVVVPYQDIFIEIEDIGERYQDGIFNDMISTFKFQ